MNKLDSFLKKMIGFSLGPVIGAFISFITVPLTTYFISPTEFGKASMFTVVQSLIVTFIYLGIDQSYTREYHYYTNKKYLFQNALFVPLLCSLILSSIIYIYKGYFSELLFNSDQYSYISVLFSLMIIFSVIERFVMLTIRMEEHSVEYSLFSILTKILILLLTLVLISLGDRTFLTVIYSTIFGQILGDLIIFIKYRYLFLFNYKTLDRNLLKRMVLFGLPLIIAASVNNLLNTTGRFFLRGYSSFDELGLYNAALKLAALVTIVQTAFTSFWVPTAYRWNKEKREIKHFSFVGDSLLFVMTFIFFAILILKKYIILVLSVKYIDAQYIIGLLALIPILYTISETTTLGIVFSGKSYYNILISIFSLIPNIILCYYLIPKFGIKGAAISAAVSYIIFCNLRTYYSKKCEFNISFLKQFINIFIFFIASLVNMNDYKYSFLLTIILFLVSILTQISILNTIKQIKRNPTNWDFS